MNEQIKKIILTVVSLVVIVCAVASLPLSIGSEFLAFQAVLSEVLGIQALSAPLFLTTIASILSIVTFSILIAFEIKSLVDSFNLGNNSNKIKNQQKSIYLSFFKLFVYSNVLALNIAAVAGLSVSAVYGGIIFPIIILMFTGGLLCNKIYNSESGWSLFDDYLNKPVAFIFALCVIAAIVGVVFGYVGLSVVPIAAIGFFVAIVFGFSNTISRVSKMWGNIFGNQVAGAELSQDGSVTTKPAPSGDLGPARAASSGEGVSVEGDGKSPLTLPVDEEGASQPQVI